WQTLAAPGIAGVANYLLWKGVALGWAPQSALGTNILFCVASACSFFLTIFVCALAGGYDPIALAEFQQASRMTAKFVRPLSRAFYLVAARGAKLAPFRAKTLPLAEEAHREAAELDAAAAAALAAGVVVERKVPAMAAH